MNPVNACQVCQVATSTSTWTARFGQCGENFDRFYCDGVCCELRACCDLSSETSDFDICPTCAIAGELYFLEDRNPANGCEICPGQVNKFDRTLVPDNNFCDESQSVVCCSGSCCNPGEGCIQGVFQPI